MSVKSFYAVELVITRRVWGVSNGTDANRIQETRTSTATPATSFLSTVASVSDFAPTTAGSVAVNTRTKAALMFSATGKRATRDGGVVAVSATVPPVSGMNTLSIGSALGSAAFYCGWIESFAYYDKQDFTDPQLQALST